mgnify:CR=1 FL=1
MNIRENLMDIATVFWRDWVVLKRRLAKFILSRMVAPMLYLVAFGWGLGRSIQVASGTYLDFLVPGILALNSMNISFNSITRPVGTSFSTAYGSLVLNADGSYTFALNNGVVIGHFFIEGKTVLKP